MPSKLVQHTSDCIGGRAPRNVGIWAHKLTEKILPYRGGRHPIGLYHRRNKKRSQGKSACIWKALIGFSKGSFAAAVTCRHWIPDFQCRPTPLQEASKGFSLRLAQHPWCLLLWVWKSLELRIYWILWLSIVQIAIMDSPMADPVTTLYNSDSVPLKKFNQYSWLKYPFSINASGYDSACLRL